MGKKRAHLPIQMRGNQIGAHVGKVVLPRASKPFHNLSKKDEGTEAGARNGNKGIDLFPCRFPTQVG